MIDNLATSELSMQIVILIWRGWSPRPSLTSLCDGDRDNVRPGPKLLSLVPNPNPLFRRHPKIDRHPVQTKMLFIDTEDFKGGLGRENLQALYLFFC